MIYGYARVSTSGQAKDGNSLEAQEIDLKSAGAIDVYSDVSTGAKIERPELDKLIQKLKDGDMVIVTRIDRIARNLSQGIELIESLNKRGIKVNVLNMGIIDNSPIGKLIRNIMLSFAEFEREMIIQRTQAGKKIAQKNPGFHDGRPKKFNRAQTLHALALLKDYSYSQVSEMTGISRATLVRMKAQNNINPL